MPVHNRIADFAADMTAWRRDIHTHPELAFDEHRTSDLVADKLASWGIEVTRGIAGTGLVGTLRNGASTRTRSASGRTWTRCRCRKPTSSPTGRRRRT